MIMLWHIKALAGCKDIYIFKIFHETYVVGTHLKRLMCCFGETRKSVNIFRKIYSLDVSILHNINETYFCRLYSLVNAGE